MVTINRETGWFCDLDDEAECHIDKPFDMPELVDISERGFKVKMSTVNPTLFSRIRYYIQMSKEFQAHLAKAPQDWEKVQEIFNLSVDKVYQDIMEFERENIDRFEEKVYKFKKIFEKRYRSYFLHGGFIKWSFEKPFGYSGDFRIIDDIYQNRPSTTGFDRLWDNYFQQLSAVEAIRERKEDLKKIMLAFIQKRENENIHIMNLAAGPAREVKELIEIGPDKAFSKVVFDCYDFESQAINYARQLLNGKSNVNFYKKNAIRLALSKDIESLIPIKYDLIYSAGLFDYLDERIAIRLIGNLKKLLKKNGLMLIMNASEKYNNSSAGWMEWVAEWYLIYRSEDELRRIFLDAGFSPEDLKIKLQNKKIMRYCLAANG